VEYDAVAGFVLISEAGAGGVEHVGLTVCTCDDYEHLLTVSFAVHPILTPSKCKLTRGAVGTGGWLSGHRLGWLRHRLGVRTHRHGRVDSTHTQVEEEDLLEPAGADQEKLE